MTLRLPRATVEFPWRHIQVPFLNIASLPSRSTKCRQYRHIFCYYGIVFAHLAIGFKINAKGSWKLDSDWWISHSSVAKVLATPQLNSPIWPLTLWVLCYIRPFFFWEWVGFVSISNIKENLCADIHDIFIRVHTWHKEQLVTFGARLFITTIYFSRSSTYARQRFAFSECLLFYN